MTFASKKFSRSLYLENDNKAKLAGFHYLLTTNATWCSINKNDYGCDVVYRVSEDPDAAPLLLETEVKHTWKGGIFPYPTINVLQRKAKYFLEGADLLLLAGNMQDYLILTADTILSHEPTEIANKYVFSQEYFYQVPVLEARFYRLPTKLTNLSVVCQCGNKSYNIKDASLKCEGCGKKLI